MQKGQRRFGMFRFFTALFLLSGDFDSSGDEFCAVPAFVPVFGLDPISQLVRVGLFTHCLVHGRLPVNLTAFGAQHGAVAAKILFSESCVAEFAGNHEFLISSTPSEAFLFFIQFLCPEAFRILAHLVLIGNGQIAQIHKIWESGVFCRKRVIQRFCILWRWENGGPFL